MNLTNTVHDLIVKYGLSNLLANIAKQVQETKHRIHISIVAAKLADIAFDLNKCSQTAQSAELLQEFERIYGKPKMRIVVYDYTRDNNLENKFTVHIRTPELAPESEVLQESHLIDRKAVDHYITQLRNRYDIIDVVDLEWFPTGDFHVEPDDIV